MKNNVVRMIVVLVGIALLQCLSVMRLDVAEHGSYQLVLEQVLVCKALSVAIGGVPEFVRQITTLCVGYDMRLTLFAAFFSLWIAGMWCCDLSSLITRRRVEQGRQQTRLAHAYELTAPPRYGNRLLSFASRIRYGACSAFLSCFGLWKRGLLSEGMAAPVPVSCMISAMPSMPRSFFMRRGGQRKGVVLNKLDKFSPEVSTCHP